MCAMSSPSTCSGHGPPHAVPTACSRCTRDLYEIEFNLLAIPILIWARPRVPVQGDLLKAYLLSAAIFRFGVEFVRGNEVQAFGLTGPQIVLVPCVVLLAAHFLRQARIGVYRVPDAPTAPSGISASSATADL